MYNVDAMEKWKVVMKMLDIREMGGLKYVQHFIISLLMFKVRKKIFASELRSFSWLVMSLYYLPRGSYRAPNYQSSFNGYQASSRLSSWNRAMRDYDSGYAEYQAPSRLNPYAGNMRWLF